MNTRHRFFGILLAVIATVTFGMFEWEARALNDGQDDINEKLEIGQASLSQDGQMLVFSMSFQGRVSRLGTLDLESNDLTVFFELDVKRSWHDPVLLPNGNQIVADSFCNRDLNAECVGDVAGHQIAVIDTHTLKYRLVTKGRFHNYSPRVSADGRYITFTSVARNDDLEPIGPMMVRQYDTKTKTIRTLFPTSQLPTNFGLQLPPTMIGDNRYVFSAVGPQNNADLSEFAKELPPHPAPIDESMRSNRDHGISQVGYEYREGMTIKPLFFNLEFEPKMLTASSDGRRLLFVERSLSRPVGDDGRYNVELFLVEDEAVQQITDVQGLIHRPFVSADGSRASFLMDPTKRQKWDVWIIDLPDGKPQSTGLRSLLVQDIIRDTI